MNALNWMAASSNSGISSFATITAECIVMRNVMRSIEQLTEEILSLPSESRAFLADKLVESLEFDTDSKIQAVWLTEAKRRRDEVRDGSV